ncbi:MAG TPA: 16S rRNA (guanine(966)-N(2))-methyltransferase RsmD [Kofleriaceae bacterium]
MRIVGGDLSGRVLRAPAGAATRPTSEKVREAMFGILANRLGSLEGAHVLDLFAGSGALGIEALSRGAAHVTFVDSGKPQLAVVKQNLAELGVADRARVLPGDAVAWAGKLQPPEPFRLVFIDPPYASDLALRAVNAIPAANIARDGMVVIEHDRRNAPPERLGSMVRTDDRRYGDTLLSFYEVSA